MGFEDFKKEAQKEKNKTEYNRNIGPDHVKPQAEVKTEENYAKDLINRITYEVPEGMTEEVAMAIAMGAMLDDELLKNSNTSSSSGASSVVEFRRSYMVTNGLIGDGIRGNDFYFVMPRARELAREAFEKYKNGDRSDVDRYAANVMRVAGDLIIGEISTSKGSSAQSFVCQCACTLYDSGYAKEEVPSQLYLDKIRWRVAVHELMHDAVIQTARLAENFPEANSAEREEALLTIMAANTIRQNNFLSQQVYSPIESVSREFFSEELEDVEHEYRVKMLNNEKNRALEGMVKNILFPDEYMLADQERRTAYVEAVKKYIRTTDNFKKLLEADEEYFAENFSSLSEVNLSEEKIYEMVGAENMELVNQENRSNADQQATILEDYMQHAKEKAEEYERQVREQEEVANASFRKNADAIREILLSCAKETQGLGDKADQAEFYDDTGETCNLEQAVEGITKNGRTVYLKHPSREVMMQFTPKNNEDGTISLEQRETTAFQYSSSLPIENTFTMQQNMELARKITLPHEVGSLPGMEKLSFCKRQLVDAAYGIDMAADYHAVIDAIEEAEQYYKGLYKPQDGAYPVFGNDDKEGLQRVFDSVLQAVSEYQNTNPFGMVMDNVKEAVHEGMKYVNELQLDDRKLSLKARVSIQEAKDLDGMMVGRTYTKDLEKEQTAERAPRDITQKEKEFFAKTERVDIYSRETYEAYSKDFKKVYDELSATEGFFHGSKQQYKDMKSTLEQLIQAGKEEPDTARYQSLLNNMRDAVQNYIDYKKDDLGSSTSRKRFDLANQLKNLTGTVRKEVFEGLEMQNERDVMAVNRKIKEAVKAEEQPAGHGLSEQLFSISDSLREKLAPANERMKEVLEMRKEERRQLERMIKEFPDVEQYKQTLYKVEDNEATDREKTAIDAFQKLYNDKFVKGTIAQQKEGINKGLQGDMLKYAATVQKIAKSLDQMIPNEVQGARAELASKLHAFAGKRHPNSIDTCAFITGIKETMQTHQTEFTDSADPVYRQITELVTNHESHFADLKLAETEQYMIDGRKQKATSFSDYLDNQQELRSELLPKEPQQELKQVEADKSVPMA